MPGILTTAAGVNEPARGWRIRGKIQALNIPEAFLLQFPGTAQVTYLATKIGPSLQILSHVGKND